MYQHFRSKEDIAVEYLVARHGMWMGKLNDCVSRKSTSKNKVIGCFDYLIEWLTEVNFRGCGWQNIITDLPEENHKIKAQAVYHKNELRKWIHNLLLQEEQYKEEEVLDLGDQVLILIEGAIIFSQIQKESWPIESAKKACIKILT